MQRKISEYFASGAQQVWHMFPETQTVTVYTAPTEAITYAPEAGVGCRRSAPRLPLPRQ